MVQLLSFGLHGRVANSLNAVLASRLRRKMPAKFYQITASDEKFVIVCQRAYSICRCESEDPFLPRLMILFICGRFTLDEANAFTIEALDNPVVPKTDEFFSSDVEVSANAFSVPIIPTRLRHIVNTYSTVDFVDKYMFFLMKLETDNFFNALIDAEKRDLCRVRKARRDRRRLGLPAVEGTSDAELQRSRPIVRLHNDPVFETMYGDMTSR